MALASTVNANTGPMNINNNNNKANAKGDATLSNKISLRPPRLLLFPLNSSSAFIRGSTSTTRTTAAATLTTTPIMKNLTKEELQKGIANFYDESSGIWEDIWGDHMHHGFYDTHALPSLSDHRAAQIRMIEEALRFAGLADGDETETGETGETGEEAMKMKMKMKRRPKSVVDVGCGIGGSSRYLAAKYGAKCQGITLSPFQAQRANALASAQGLADKVSIRVADALQQPFDDGQFDLVWSMESGEHMPDKTKFVNELARVAAPGGSIIIVTWCHRDLQPGEESLEEWEQNLLNKICDAYYLPAWCSTSDYVSLLQSLALQDIKAADWSQNVAPFWPAVIRSALTWKGFTSLLRSGMKTIRGALAMPSMIEGYKKGVIKFAIITCRKPQ